ncbi:MAG TPA: hypothetical protein VNA68_03180 [Candidatus Dormibacteraeota bacterium]|nr:hypothetical protein [Candidatus Dormibacteraeota bacterium]
MINDHADSGSAVLQLTIGLLFAAIITVAVYIVQHPPGQLTVQGSNAQSVSTAQVSQ